MDLMVRDWMIIIGAALILIVLADAVRRVYQDRRSEVRLNAKIARRDQESDDEDDAFNLLNELPNGGARIVQRSDLQSSEATGNASPEGALVDPVAPPEPDATASSADGMYDDPSADLPSFSATDPGEPVVSFAANDNTVRSDHADQAPKATEDADVPAVAADDSPETMDWLDSLEVPEPEPEPEARLPREIDPHVFVLNVAARSEQGFSGSDILGVLLACDLRFGDMDFFHRHEQRAGRGPIQFSVCNMMRPGVFNIDAMDDLYTKGLMFFVTLPGPEDMLKAFDYMHETAKVVAKNLDGDVLDETRSAITRQSLEHMRQQIRELERRIAMQQRR
ncbi:MAG: cell division protein ZipA [Luminiphilus sp.]|nr:cell division protein ZipA [Luminiphilus sp.]